MTKKFTGKMRSVGFPGSPLADKVIQPKHIKALKQSKTLKY